MTEQLIENRLISLFDDELKASNIEDIQIIGAWQTVDEGKLKSIEEEDKIGILSIKVFPRQYDTFTIPDANFSVEVQLVMRAEIDYTGRLLLDVSNAVSSLMHKWQKRFNDYESAFIIDDKFQPTGFRLDGGDVGLDETKTVWTYAQSFTMQGIILD